MKRQVKTSMTTHERVWKIANVKTEVIFGSPKNRCRGVGICKVMTLSAIQETNRPIAYLSVNKGGRVKFDFLKETITEAMLKMHFKDDLFVVVDEFQFTDILLKRLDRKALRIANGIYEVKQTERFLSVVF
ncbi:MAG: hypothetical protein AAF849_14275 [Bacteroidota bacterium]